MGENNFVEKFMICLVDGYKCVSAPRLRVRACDEQSRVFRYLLISKSGLAWN